MKALGIVRGLDQLGRIVVPKEWRDTYNWEPTTPIEMLSTKDGLLLRKYERGCKFCGNLLEVHNIEGIDICTCCMKKLAKKLEEVK